MEHDNLFIQILEILSIKYTKDFTLRFYEKHPHKNSLFGLSEMLRYYKIENVAAEIQKHKNAYPHRMYPLWLT